MGSFAAGMADGLKLGLFSVNSYACSHPVTAARVARVAETAGFESLGTGALWHRRPTTPDHSLLGGLVKLNSPRASAGRRSANLARAQR